MRRIGVAVTLSAMGVLASTLAPTTAPMAHAGTRECAEGRSQFVPDSPPALGRLAAPQAWRLSTGKGVVVAVVDSGVSANNVHFPAGSVLPGKSFVGGSATTDENGHGTALAGVIAARDIGEKSGVVGVARDAVILPVKISGGEGGDEEQQRSANLAGGIAYAVSAGADVINLSLSTTGDRRDVRAAIASAVKAGIIVVASGGNREQASEASDGMRYPAGYPGVIGVAATDNRDVVTENSIRGPQVDLSAPGDNVITTFRSWGDCVYSQQQQSSSYATAYVSGAAALLRQRFPSASAADISYRLTATASRGSRTARDDTSGWGVVQPYEAMTAALDSSVSGPVPPGGVQRPSPEAQASAVDLTPAQDPRAPDRAAVQWLLLGSGAAVLGLAMARMLRRPSRS
ncbi:S8 family serine peptidase [Knoellia sinensis]|uniref:S8 family serine peptidase n=1 Tax=Knoellia sinensis TaxID=136100 RepID=UPI000AD7F80B|nr:S8 family serine peptidase [Knoellia sinensis]